ncbi:MAG: DegT/DnrJ/EryC1/StrS family aminotransferase [Saprospiraceae bacterium]
MSKLRTSVGIIKSLWFYLIGKKINQTNLSFGTVDWDDIKIAIKFLLRPIPKSSLQIIQTYENAFSSFNGSKFAFSFFQGRVALNACLYALDLKEGDKIVIPAYTCVGVANACWIQKLKIEFCDIELETFGLSFMDFEAILSKHPDVRAVVVQHLFGLVCRDFQQILDYCKQKGIYVIEDCAHATGTEFKGRKVGNFGEVAFFSSEQSKVFNTLTGGMAVTNNKQLASKMATFREKCKVSSKKQVSSNCFHN